MANPQIMAMVEGYNRGILPPAKKNAVEELARRGEPGILDAIKNYGEAAATMGSSAIAEPLSGLYGLAQGAIGGAEAGAQGVEQAREALTYQPSAGGREALQNINETIMGTPIVGEALQMVSEAPEGVGDYVFEKTGSPLAAALAAGGTGAGMEVGVPAGMAARLTRPVSKEALATANMFVNPARLVGAEKARQNVDNIRQLKQPLKPAEKSKFTRIQNKLIEGQDVTDKEMADLAQLDERVRFQYEPNQDRYIWEKYGMFELPTGEYVSEIGDQDAVLKPLAKAYINPRGKVNEPPKMDQLTYRKRKDEQGNDVYDLTMRREGAQTSADIIDVPGLTESQLIKTLPSDLVGRVAMGKGDPDVYDLNADEWTEDALTIDEPYQLKTQQNLFDLVDHEKLQQTYPELENIEVDLKNMSDEKGGSFTESIGAMTANTAKDPESVLSTLLHETQHAVQAAENYPRGGSPASMGMAINKAIVDAKTQKRRLTERGMMDAEKDVEPIREFMARAKNYRPMDIRDTDLADNMNNLSQAAYDVDYLDRLKQLRDSDRPHKFVNDSAFYRDANEYRREYGIEPKGPKKSGPVKNWWRGLIDYSAARTVEEMNPNESDFYFKLRDDIAEGKTSTNKIRGALGRVKEKLAPAMDKEKEINNLLSRRGDVQDRLGFVDTPTKKEFQAYRDLYGEQQARDVQARQKMPDAIRQSTLPMDELKNTENRFNTAFPYSPDVITYKRD